MDRQRRLMCASGLAIGLAAGLGACASGGDARQGAAAGRTTAELSGTGKMRAAINLGNPILAGRGPDGQVKVSR